MKLELNESTSISIKFLRGQEAPHQLIDLHLLEIIHEFNRILISAKASETTTIDTPDKPKN